MALFVLTILGISLGWLSSILARTEAAGAILRQIGVGLVAALIADGLVNSGTMLGGLSPLGLGAAVVAAIAALGLYYALVTRRDPANY